MWKRVVFIILIVAGAAVVVWVVMRTFSKEGGLRATERSRREWDEAQYSQEIVCDACGESTTGLVLNRAQAGNFQVCPKCGQTAGRPVVYYMCQNRECNRQLVKAPNTVWTDEGASPAPALTCPKCSQTKYITPLFLDLRSAQRIANETGQEFP